MWNTHEFILVHWVSFFKVLVDMVVLDVEPLVFVYFGDELVFFLIDADSNYSCFVLPFGFVVTHDDLVL